MSAAPGRARRASWPERGATSMVFLTLGLTVGAWAAALPGLKLKLGLTTGELSLGLFSLSVGSVIASTISGFVLPRFGTGRATGFAALAVALSFSLMPLTSSLSQFLMTGLAIGLAIGTLEVAVNGHAGDIEVRWGDPIMSSFHGGFSLGGLIGSALGGLIVWSGLGVEAQIWIPAALAGLCNLAVMPFLGHGQATRTDGSGVSWPSRTLLGLCVVVMFIYVIEGAMADWSALYLSSVTGSSLAMAAVGYSAFSVSMAVGRLGGDAVMAKFGPRWVVGLGGCLTAVGLGVAVAVTEPVVAIAGFALVGIGAANIVPAVTSAATRAGSSPAAGVALVTTVGYAGFLSGPPLIGSIAALSGLRVAITGLVGAALIAAVAGFIVFDRKAERS